MKPSEVRELEQQLFIAITLGLLVMLSVVGSSAAAIGPISRLTRGTKALAEGHQERVTVDSKDELGQLGTAFNNMATARRAQDDVRRRNGAAMFGRVSMASSRPPPRSEHRQPADDRHAFDDLEYARPSSARPARLAQISACGGPPQRRQAGAIEKFTSI
jgi:HAMP domain-containing protein